MGHATVRWLPRRISLSLSLLPRRLRWLPRRCSSSVLYSLNNTRDLGPVLRMAERVLLPLRGYNGFISSRCSRLRSTTINENASMKLTRLCAPRKHLLLQALRLCFLNMASSDAMTLFLKYLLA